MKLFVLALLATIAAGLLEISQSAAGPANGTVLGQAAATNSVLTQVPCAMRRVCNWRRCWMRRMCW
jgi:hypothetical protein